MGSFSQQPRPICHPTTDCASMMPPPGQGMSPSYTPPGADAGSRSTHFITI